MALFCAAIRRDSVSLLRSEQLFYSQFLFVYNCCSVDPCLVYVVSGRCNYFYCFTLWELFTSALADGFHWSLSAASLHDSPQYSSRFNHAVVWMVSTRPLISRSPRSCIKTLGTVPSTLTTIGITLTFIFHSFFSSLARSRHLSFFSLSFSFILWSAWTAMSTTRQVLFLLLLFFGGGWLSLCLVVWPRLGDQFLSQNPREVF